MSAAPVFASADEALDMVRAGLAYLAAVGAAQMTAEAQAECLRGLEQAGAAAIAAQASVLAGFAAGQGYAGDAEYSAVSWLTTGRMSPGARPSVTPRGPGGSAPIRGCWPRWRPGRSPNRPGG